MVYDKESPTIAGLFLLYIRADLELPFTASTLWESLISYKPVLYNEQVGLGGKTMLLQVFEVLFAPTASWESLLSKLRFYTQHLLPLIL